jgi:hypothetical protein
MSRVLFLVASLALCPLSVAGQIMPGGKGVEVDAQQAQFNGVII